MGPLEAGLWTAPSGVVFAAGSLASPVLARRVRPANLMAAGLALSVAGLAAMAGVRALGPSPALVAGYLAFCLGLTPVGGVWREAQHPGALWYRPGRQPKSGMGRCRAGRIFVWRNESGWPC
jgi:hypothetical protein